MTSRLDWREVSAFNDIVQHACLRPKMYCGTDDFDNLVCWIHTFDAGVAFAHKRRSLHLPTYLTLAFECWLHSSYGARMDERWADIIKNRSSQTTTPFEVLSDAFGLFSDSLKPPLVLLGEQAEDGLEE